MQYTAIFHGCKNGNFQMKNGDSFLIFAQNMDPWYMLELPHGYLCFRAKIRKKSIPVLHKKMWGVSYMGVLA